jgi:hypothetical protein
MKFGAVISVTMLVFLISCGEQPVKPRMSASTTINDVSAVNEPPLNKTLCAPAEAVLFRCRTGDTRISVCGKKVGDGTHFSAIYREKRGDRPEIVISAPLNSQPPTIARTMYSGGGEVQFRFSNRRTAHILYARVIRTGPDEFKRWVPEHQAGVADYSDGKFVRDRSCNDGGGLAVTNDDGLSRYFRPGDFVYVQLEDLQ